MLEFKKYVKEIIKALEEKGYIAEMAEYKKPDLTGSSILTIYCKGSPEIDGTRVGTSINIRMMYDYEIPIKDAVELIEVEVAEAESALDGELYLCSLLSDWEYSREHLVIKLVNANEYTINGELGRFAHKFLDGTDGQIAIIYGVIVEDTDECDIFVIISTENLVEWGITLDVLHEAALKLTLKNFPHRICKRKELYKEITLNKFMEEIPAIKDFVEAHPEIDPEGIADYMYFLTDDSHCGLGAVTILYPGVIDEIYNRFGDSYMLPSSVGEWIIVPLSEVPDGMGKSDFADRIKFVNEIMRETKNGEVLSDSLYGIFNGKFKRFPTGKLIVA